MPNSEMPEKNTALFSADNPCPCQSGKPYQDCCQPFHQETTLPATAEQLMRSRYAAFVLQDIDYIVKTTVPNQQSRLDKAALAQWAAETNWVGLTVKKHQPRLSPRHSAVEFEAFFATDTGVQAHHEHSLFVYIDKRWYFVDPTVDLPTMKQPCLCGSTKKFKHCCGAYL